MLLLVQPDPVRPTMSANIDILHLYNVNIVRRAVTSHRVDRHLAGSPSDHRIHVSCFSISADHLNGCLTVTNLFPNGVKKLSCLAAPSVFSQDTNIYLVCFNPAKPQPGQPPTKHRTAILNKKQKAKTTREGFVINSLVKACFLWPACFGAFGAIKLSWIF